MRKTIILILMIIPVIICFNNVYEARADEFTDSVNEQMDELDLSALEDYYSDIMGNDDSITEKIKKMLGGKFDYSYQTVADFFIDAFFLKVKNLIAPILSVIAIAVFLAVINGIKGSFLSSSTYETVFFACFSTITVVLF